MAELEMACPRWAVPLIPPCRYKGAKGGRGSGKSHLFAELAVATMASDPYLDFVCIREIQKSLKFSAKKLVEEKIRAKGLQRMFDITDTEIRRRRTGGHAVMIFQGMQDHTADSIKSLEGFGRAWVEEAHSLRKRSVELLLPTIRAEGSEIWFSWNPDDEDDPVDVLFRQAEESGDSDFVCVHVNYADNPWLPQTLRREAERCRAENPTDFAHIWLGSHKQISDAQVLKDKWVIEEFAPGKDWDGPYYGLDFGFANDPTAAVKCWSHDGCLFIEQEAGRIGLEIDDMTAFLTGRMPGIEKYVVRADCSRPESISYLKRNGLQRVTAAKKWPGSVEDGISHLRGYRKIVVHPRCVEVARECRLYAYKTDRATGDILPVPVDANNHYIDAIRYAIEPIVGSTLERKKTKPLIEDEPEHDGWGRPVTGADSWKTA